MRGDWVSSRSAPSFQWRGSNGAAGGSARLNKARATIVPPFLQIETHTQHARFLSDPFHGEMNYGFERKRLARNGTDEQQEQSDCRFHCRDRCGRRRCLCLHKQKNPTTKKPTTNNKKKTTTTDTTAGSS